MDINYLVLLFVAIILAIAYGLLGYFNDRIKNGGEWNWTKFYVTLIYSIAIGVIAVQTGIIDFTKLNDWQTLFSPVWESYIGIYVALMYIVGKIVDPILNKTFVKINRAFIMGDSTGGDIVVNFDILPKGEIKVGETITITDIERNLKTLSFGDGSIWMWTTGDEPFIATHKYAKAGTYIIQGNTTIGTLNGYMTKTIVITSDTPPTPDPAPVVKTTWLEVLIYWIKTLLGIK